MRTEIVGNAYFNGRDMIVRDGERSARVNVKDGMPAVEVKDHNLHAHDPETAALMDRLSEDRVQAIYEDVQYGFWTLAVDELAREHDFGPEVFQAGRSGGWVCVEGTSFLDTIALDSDETIDGSEEGDDISDAFRERERFFRFALDCRELADDYAGYQFQEALRSEVAAKDREASERADAAARDILTID